MSTSWSEKSENYLVEEGDLLNTTWKSKVISLFINLYCPNFIIVQSIGRFSLWQRFASNLSLILETLACSRRSDSGERCEVKGARKNKSKGGGEVREAPLPSPPLLFIPFFTSHRSPLSERLEQAKKPWPTLFVESLIFQLIKNKNSKQTIEKLLRSFSAFTQSDWSISELKWFIWQGQQVVYIYINRYNQFEFQWSS